MRTNLVTHLMCEACGDLLEIVEVRKSWHPVDGRPRSSPHQRPDEPKLPTGAALATGVVIVKPCATCVEPLKRSARKIADGLRELGGEHG